MGAADVWRLAKTLGCGGLTVTLSVLMFCSQFRPLVGGAERQAERLSKALAKQGVRITVLTPKLHSDSLEYEEDAGVAIRRFPLFDLCRRFPSMPGLGPANLLGLSIQTRRAVLEFIETHDLVHAHGISALTAFALYAAKDLHKPFVCKIASSGSGFDLKKLAEIGIGGPFLANYLRDHATAWIGTTNVVAESLKDFGVSPERVLRIPDGVELPSLTACCNRTSVRRFLYVGRLSRACDRDFDTLFEAFSRLVVEYKDAELAFVGDGDLFESIKAKACRSTFALRVHLPGLIKDPSVWYEWADCFVLPSRREGMSNALIEAMSYGLVCIANDVPANREVLEDGRVGFLTSVGSIEELLSTMTRIAAQDNSRMRFGELGSTKAKNEYGIETLASKHIIIYDDLIRKESGTIVSNCNK